MANHKISTHINWLNTKLNSNFNRIEELRDGAAFCQLMHMIYPESLPLETVKFAAASIFDFVENFYILQTAIKKMRIKKTLNMEQLITGYRTDNLQLLIWFRKVYAARFDGRAYDAKALRNGASMGMGLDIANSMMSLGANNNPGVLLEQNDSEISETRLNSLLSQNVINLRCLMQIYEAQQKLRQIENLCVDCDDNPCQTLVTQILHVIHETAPVEPTQ